MPCTFPESPTARASETKAWPVPNPISRIVSPARGASMPTPPSGRRTEGPPQRTALPHYAGARRLSRYMAESARSSRVRSESPTCHSAAPIAALTATFRLVSPTSME